MIHFRYRMPLRRTLFFVFLLSDASDFKRLPVNPLAVIGYSVALGIPFMPKITLSLLRRLTLILLFPRGRLSLDRFVKCSSGHDAQLPFLVFQLLLQHILL